MAPERPPHVVVIGDVLADTDLHGHADRLCPDAPAPVVDEDRTVHRPGGAGLAATLAARAGARVTLVAAFADDVPGRRLRRLLQEAGVELVPLRWCGTTVEKVRVHAGGRPLLRLDRGEGGLAAAVPDDVVDALTVADAVLVADYGRGVASHPRIRAALTTTCLAGTPVVWDPHPRGATPVAGSTLVCPNETEATRFAPEVEASGPLTTAVALGRQLRVRWNVGGVVVTRGADGAVVVVGDGAPLSVPVLEPANGNDTCGAGDAFAAAAATALARRAVVSEAVQHAVTAAARFVSAGGAAELSAGAKDTRPRERADAGDGAGAIVAAGGCFDILHPGHVHTLRAARRLGDRLVVLVNDDDSVRRLKGPDRPLQPVEDRCAVLRSLADVDEVVVFSEDTPVATLRRLKPDVFVKGGDYTATDLPETPVLAEWGGSVVTVPFLDGRSTTQLVSRARADGRKEPDDAQMG